MVIHKKTMRSENEKAVLQRILNESPISKSQIARDVNLNKVTVSQTVNQFISNGLVMEVGAGVSTQQGGRKPELLQINSKYGYIICFDLGYKELNLLSMSINGKRLDNEKVTFTDEDINLAIKKMNEMIDQEREKYGERLLGVLVSVHGIVHKNKVIYSPFWNMKDIDLAEKLSQNIDGLVLLENEANLTAIFERDFGANNINNAVSISMHKGIGAGIIIDGNLYRGRKGEAGEIGQTISFETRNDSLEQSQKIEDVASQEAVLEQIKEVKKLNYINLELVRQMYENNDVETLKVLDAFENNISKLINNVIVSFDPDVLVINAYIFKEFPEILERIKNKFSKISVRNTPIKISKNVETASLYGGCAQLIRKILGVSELKLEYNK